MVTCLSSHCFLPSFLPSSTVFHSFFFSLFLPSLHPASQPYSASDHPQRLKIMTFSEKQRMRLGDGGGGGGLRPFSPHPMSSLAKGPFTALLFLAID